MSQRARADGSGNVFVQIAGNGNSVLLPEQPYLRLTRYLQRREVREEDGKQSEADLVTAYTRSVPFVGRQAEIDDLWAWLENGDPISVRVLIGTAGRGKTRLALELCEQATTKGWGAGFATSSELDRFRTKQNAASWGWKTPVLVVVDYVSSQAALLHEWLVELADNAALSDPEAGKKRPLRLLLLERQADPQGGWWQEVFGRGGGDARAVQRLPDPSGPITLPPITSPQLRREIIASTLAQVGSQLRPPSPGQNPNFDAKLAELSWGGEPLFLMMAALLAAKSGFAAVLALSRDDLALKIADRELDRIGKIAKAGGVPKAFAGHMAAVVTLCQGLARDAAFAAIDREKVALGRDNAGDKATIHDVLLSALSHAGDHLDPILPDMVGEAVLLGVWDEQAGTEAALRAVGAGYRAQVVETVMRTCQDYAIHGNATPLAWLDALGSDAAADLPALLQLCNALPPDTVELRERAAELIRTAVEGLRGELKRRDKETSKSLLAAGLNNFSNRLSDLGHREDALAASKEAVALYRQLAAARPDAFRPGLATSLNNLSNRLSDIGHREDALAAGEEAVAIRRALAAARPDAFRPDLAMSLNNLSKRLSRLGRREDALAAGEEAVAIRRALAATRPDAFRPDLAGSLNNLSVCLSNLGRREDALATIEEAVTLYRELAAVRPDAFRPRLAGGLNDLSGCLSDLDHLKEDALAASKEAVELYRALAAARPDAFLPPLAMSLDNLSISLSNLGRREDALAASEEAVAINRDLAAARPDVFRPELAMSLGARGMVLRKADFHGDAAASFAEGLATLAPYFLQAPEGFGHLATGLLQAYLSSAQEAGIEPDFQSLRPVIEKLVEIGAIQETKDQD